MPLPDPAELKDTRRDRECLARDLATLASVALTRSRNVLEGEDVPVPGEYQFVGVATALLDHQSDITGGSDASYLQGAIAYIGSGGTR